MNNEKLNIILSVLDGSSNRLRDKYFIKNRIDLYTQIIEYTSEISDLKFKNKVWHWVNERPDYILCACGTRVSHHMNWMDGYKKYCSSKCSANSQDAKEKAKETLMLKYGVDHYSKTDEYVEKVKKTSLEKWGVDNYSKTEDFVNKSKSTFLSKYGVDSYTKTQEYLDKSKKTCVSKYGVDNYVKTDEYRNKFRSTCLDRYGVEHIFKSDFYRVKNFGISKNTSYIKYLGDGLSQFSCEDCGQLFEIKTDDYYGRKRSGNKLCTVCNPISSLNSIKESSILEFIKSIYDGEVVGNWRNKYEIDIYLPGLNIGFEFNGLWWHSDRYKDKYYHIDKTNHFESLGIKIIHIWEDDWIYRQNIVKSQISNSLKLNGIKIYARKCIVKEISHIEASQFLEDNHIQGHVKSFIKLGLYHCDDLISVMTFDHFEGRKRMLNTEWNLSRFCNKLGLNCVGGASKMLRFFMYKWNPTRIISYADRDWSTGGLYEKIGFEKVYLSKPDYKYIIGDKRVHKSNYRKSLMKREESESEYMKDVPKLWDCGKIKFEIKNPLL